MNAAVDTGFVLDLYWIQQQPLLHPPSTFRNTAVRMRPYLLLPILLLFPAMASAQGMHVHHAFTNVCQGYMYYDEPVDSIVWSTGAMGTELFNVPPGTYGFTAYVNGQVVNQGNPVVEEVGWNFFLTTDPYLYPGSAFMTANLEIPHCASQIFSGVCCHPEPGVTDIIVYQDGVVYPTTEVPVQLLSDGDCIGCENVNCDYWPVRFLAPPGHIYTIGVNDPTCAGLVMADTSVVAPSCANLQLLTEVVDASPGQADGVVTLMEAIPDLTEPQPIEAPVAGTAQLIKLPEGIAMGMFTNATTAQWTGLTAGEYTLYFRPDQPCQAHTIPVLVGTATGLGDVEPASALRLFPNVADQAIQLSSTASGPIHLRITDMRGREVVNTRLPAGPFPIDALAPGMYGVVAKQGGSALRTRFIKR